MLLERNNIVLLVVVSYHCDQLRELRDIQIKRQKKKEAFILNQTYSFIPLSQYNLP